MDSSAFIHTHALCESKSVGARTRIWAFVHILPGAHIGSDCNICDHVFIENDVIVGNNVTIKSGVQLWDGLRVGNDVFIGPNATFTNDKYPVSGNRDYKNLTTTIEDNVSIGANATILPGITIGHGAVVGAGSVVTKNVEPNTTVYGNPAKSFGVNN
jgi:UDP-2-acetamido-3-amino-2,3-dideoxy-glucuronate N-acetyltransferase